MKVKRVVVSMFAALTILGASPGLLTPVAAEDGQTTLTVTLNDTGVFTLSLAIDANGSIVANTSAVSAGSTVTNIRVRTTYVDTKAYRHAFDIWVSASPYTSTLQVPYAAPGTYYAFPANALWIFSSRQPRPGRCDFTTYHPDTLPGETCPNTPQANVTTTFPIGNFHALDRNGNQILPRPRGGQHAIYWSSNPTLTPPTAGDSFNTLDVPRKFNHVDAGTGTLNSDSSVFLGLTIPPAMPAATYTSTITVTTVPPGP